VAKLFETTTTSASGSLQVACLMLVLRGDSDRTMKRRGPRPVRTGA
jgi:hypothetical protein